MTQQNQFKSFCRHRNQSYMPEQPLNKSGSVRAYRFHFGSFMILIPLQRSLRVKHVLIRRL